MRHDITFPSEGLNCAGWLYVPDNQKSGEQHPAIVMAHGFSGVKEQYLDTFAEVFAAAGFVTLVFDYRYLGASEGTEQGRIIPAEQQEDYRNAITWVSLRPEVDALRIGVWGSSYSEWQKAGSAYQEIAHGYSCRASDKYRCHVQSTGDPVFSRICPADR